MIENEARSEIVKEEETTDAACCGPECCGEDEKPIAEDVKEIVREKYTEVLDGGSCCGPSCCAGDAVNMGESYHDVDGYVAEADFGLGCGLPTEYSNINPGDVVVDLGSGAGNDAFVAQHLVGQTGRVIGVDMTLAMVEKARDNRRKLGYENVEFLLGDIEMLPLENEMADVILSNCVMNLVPGKQKAFNEVYRILKKGGHFSISDIVLSGHLPDGVKQASEMYAGCVAGAMQKDEYLNTIRASGFKEVNIMKERVISIPDAQLLRFIGEEELQAYKQSGSKVVSLTVQGVK